MQHFHNLNIDYIILNSNHIESDTFMNTLNNYLEKKKDNQEHYLGFLHKKTVYKVEEYE